MSPSKKRQESVTDEKRPLYQRYIKGIQKQGTFSTRKLFSKKTQQAGSD